MDWHDNGEGKVFEKKVQKKIASLGFGIIENNHFLKFTKNGNKRKREIDTVFVDLPLVVLFEMKRTRKDSSEANTHGHLGKFKKICYMLENEESVFVDVKPHLQDELGIVGKVIWKHALVVPNKAVDMVRRYAFSHTTIKGHEIGVDVVSLRQVKNYIRSLYL